MTTLHDFNDGNGPVPAHQHCNGRGWVADTALVADTCYVGPYAAVFGNASMYDNASMHDNARIYGNARMFDNACMYGSASMGDNARMSGNASMDGNARMCGNAAATRPPLTLQVGAYPVTISDRHITIGCTTDTLHGWRTSQDLTKDPQTAAYMHAIAVIAEQHQGATVHALDIDLPYSPT